MVLDEIANVLEKRKTELIEMLEANDNPLEKQHQIYGAINEIDLFLQTLSYYEKTGKEDSEPIKLVKPPEKKDNLITKLFSGLTNKK